jgi:hypothetical protein
MVQRLQGGLLANGGGFLGYNSVISAAFVRSRYITRPNDLTCSADVLMKTGGPFRQLINMGTSFFKKAG